MGSVVISVDAELGWGFHDLQSPPTRRVEAAREGWERLLDLFEEFDVPATWAVVGHLFLDDCDGVHADHPTPSGWFARERGEWRTRPELRFGRGLVDAVLESPPDHEVGGHTFSHVEFPSLSRDVARAELAAAADAASDRGVAPESFVFPRNAVAHRDLLAEFGYVAYRGTRPGGSDRLPGTVDALAAALVPSRVPLVRPTVDEYGLVNVPASMFLFGVGGRLQRVATAVTTDPVVRAARQAIDRAASEGGVFHAWLHPNNLVEESDVRRVRSILKHVDERRAETDLRVETMGTVADRLEAKPPTAGQ